MCHNPSCSNKMDVCISIMFLCVLFYLSIYPSIHTYTCMYFSGTSDLLWGILLHCFIPQMPLKLVLGQDLGNQSMFLQEPNYLSNHLLPPRVHIRKVDLEAESGLKPTHLDTRMWLSQVLSLSLQKRPVPIFFYFAQLFQLYIYRRSPMRTFKWKGYQECFPYFSSILENIMIFQKNYSKWC